MEEFCGVHLVRKVQGVCPWCAPQYDGFDDVAATPAPVASNDTDDEDDSRPATSWRQLLQCNGITYGRMDVRGDVVGSVIATLVFKGDAAGEQVVGIQEMSETTRNEDM